MLLTFVTPHLLCPRVISHEFPDDIGEPLLCFLEERLQIPLPCAGRIADCLLQAWWW